MVAPEECKVVDLFCGAGGLTHGLIQAGFDVVAGYDSDPSCRHAYTHNNGVPFHERDLTKVLSSEIQAHYTGASRSILAGCAPCQPFSTYARTRVGTDERWQLLVRVSEIVSEIEPDAVLIENVPQLARHPVFHRFVSSLKNLKYSVSWALLDASDYGVPQTRKRLVLVANKGQRADIAAGAGIPASVRDTIGNLEPLAAGEQSPSDTFHRSCKLSALNLRRIQASTPGGSWRDWDDELRASCHRKDSGSTYPSVYGRMEWDKPSPTITTQFFGYGNGRFGHPTQDRALSLREGALLQTFPNNYQFEPPGVRLSTQRLGRLIGNAVPPLLAEHVGRAVLRSLAEPGT